ncbi:hypothetical protein D6_0146 [Aeromonas phage D6]|uniref:Uncharacterized protein n=1 Tax=Aeromonas phage D6 TaxID=2593322 RepID=A0A514TWA2_9CAUD|nr:hypothetical protein PQC08_gp129 [Aeromonas phage D6]QDJ97306.1 hypothetical protein D6_0146 [Aeromonas phage D6]
MSKRLDSLWASAEREVEIFTSQKQGTLLDRFKSLVAYKNGERSINVTSEMLQVRSYLAPVVKGVPIYKVWENMYSVSHRLLKGRSVDYYLCQFIKSMRELNKSIKQ